MSCLPKDNRLIFSDTLHSGVDFFNRTPMKRHSGCHLWTPLFSWICFFGDIFYGFYHGKSPFLGGFHQCQNSGRRSRDSRTEGREIYPIRRNGRWDPKTSGWSPTGRVGEIWTFRRCGADNWNGEGEAPIWGPRRYTISMGWRWEERRALYWFTSSKHRRGLQIQVRIHPISKPWMAILVGSMYCIFTYIWLIFDGTCR